MCLQNNGLIFTLDNLLVFNSRGQGLPDGYSASLYINEALVAQQCYRAHEHFKEQPFYKFY